MSTASVAPSRIATRTFRSIRIALPPGTIVATVQREKVRCVVPLEATSDVTL